jgi:hypothetical protein
MRCVASADHINVTSSRALALLASLASPVFMAAAVAAWLLELWPANPTTLCVACLTVLVGPLLGQAHVATASERREETFEPEFAAVTAAPISNKEERARAFHNWRDSVHPAIEYRERERRASQWLRS